MVVVFILKFVQRCYRYGGCNCQRILSLKKQEVNLFKQSGCELLPGTAGTRKCGQSLLENLRGSKRVSAIFQQWFFDSRFRRGGSQISGRTDDEKIENDTGLKHHLGKAQNQSGRSAIDHTPPARLEFSTRFISIPSRRTFSFSLQVRLECYQARDNW